MNALQLLLLVKFTYKLFLRGIIKHAIDDPNSEWDETVLSLLDKMFDYKEGD